MQWEERIMLKKSIVHIKDKYGAFRQFLWAKYVCSRVINALVYHKILFVQNIKYIFLTASLVYQLELSNTFPLPSMPSCWMTHILRRVLGWLCCSVTLAILKLGKLTCREHFSMMDVFVQGTILVIHQVLSLSLFTFLFLVDFCSTS